MGLFTIYHHISTHLIVSLHFLTINSRNLCPLCRRVWLDIIVSWHVCASPWCGVNFDVVSLCSRAPWATYSYLQAWVLDARFRVREKLMGISGKTPRSDKLTRGTPDKWYKMPIKNGKGLALCLHHFCFGGELLSFRAFPGKRTPRSVSIS